MKAFKATVALILALILVATPSAMAVDHAQITGLNQATNHLINQLNSTLSVAGEPFPIVTTEEEAEQSPAASYGAGFFVLAYERKGKIYANASADGRNWEVIYPITDSSTDCDHPAIAYLASSQKFLIVYTCTPNRVFMQAFSPTSGLIDPVLEIAANAASNSTPAIACNPALGSCLVVYENQASQIIGRYFMLNDGLSEPYMLTEDPAASGPRLAWGRDSGAYLLGYTEHPVSGPPYPAYTHIADDSAQTTIVMHASMPVRPGDPSPLEGPAFAADAAYDPCTQAFLLSYHVDGEDGGSHALWAAVIHPTAAQTLGNIYIAPTPADSPGGAIRFISADPFSPACGGLDRLVMAYIHPDRHVMAAELVGNSRPSNPAYTVPPQEEHLLVHLKPTNSAFARPVIASAMPGQPLLIAYERQFLESGMADIWGSLVHFRHQAFLPLLLR